MNKIIFLTIVITLISKFLGFSREIALSYFFGASGITDAYLVALSIPGVFSFIGLALISGFIPLYGKIKNESSEKEALEFTNNFINLLLIGAFIIYILGLYFTPQIVKIFAYGFDEKTMDITIKFTKICFLGLIFTLLVSIFSGFLQIYGKFLVTAAIGIPMNIFTIVAIYLGAKYKLIFLPIFSLLSIIAQFIFLYPFLKKYGYRYKFKFNYKDENLKKIFFLTTPVILGGGIEQINSLIDKTIASKVFLGGISVLNYATLLNTLVRNILILPVITVMFPIISNMVIKKQNKQIKRSIKEVLIYIFIILIPTFIFMILFSKELVRFFFGRGAFSEKDILLTAKVLIFYSFCILAIGMRDFITKIFYSFHDTGTSLISSIIGIAVNIILSIVLSRYYGIFGIAFATSIASWISFFVLGIRLNKYVSNFNYKYIFKVFLKITFPSMCIGLILKLIYNYTLSYIHFYLNFILIGCLGGILYFYILFFILDIKELKKMKIKFLKKIGGIFR